MVTPPTSDRRPTAPDASPSTVSGRGALPPLVELHLHLEGCLSADRARALWADRPHLQAPPTGRLGRDGWELDDLGSFLRLFGWAGRLLDGPAAYLEVLDDTLDMLERQGIIYAELFVAIGMMHYFGHDSVSIVRALGQKAAERAKAGGVDVRFIADGVRQFGVEAAGRVLDDALVLMDHRVVGFGLGGDEAAIPAGDFRELYQRAREAGLGTSLHAGEGDRPEAVAEAIDLGVDRIGHGIAAAADPEVLGRLAASAITVEVCPTSNERTGVWPAARGPHPVVRMAAAGVKVCLGSDDPAFFGTSLRQEWERCRRRGIAAEELRRWNENAARAAFLPADERDVLLERIREGR